MDFNSLLIDISLTSPEPSIYSSKTTRVTTSTSTDSQSRTATPIPRKPTTFTADTFATISISQISTTARTETETTKKGIDADIVYLV